MHTGVPTPANQLENSASSYLRSARHQPVEWHPWGEAVFARAQSLNRPILLDIGAVWCHWCHVMDGESYEDPEIAAVINEHFVAVKVDRDERPDIDSRYQAAVSAISGQGGWPLTAFLTPDGRPYYGGTYFPRDDRYGRPGFGRVLLAMAQVWSDRRDEALETASSVMAAIEHNESFSGRSADLSPALIAIHLHGHKMLINERGDFRIFVGLAVHDVAPVAPYRANIEQDGLVLSMRARERRLAPRLPIDRLMPRRAQIRRSCVFKLIAGGGWG